MNQPFAELVAATNYSFLRGASHPADMVARAIELGMAGMGIADRNSVAGLVRAHVAAKAAGVPVLLMGMLAPPNLGQDYGAKFNPIYPELAAKHGRLPRVTSISTTTSYPCSRAQSKPAT